MHRPNLVFLLITLFIFALIGNKISQPPKPTSVKNQITSATKSINMSSISSDKSDYFGFNITVPYSYFATNDEMLTNYDSQGGMAPPRLILMKGYQVMNENEYYKQVISNPSDVCIAIWTTEGYNKIEDWLLSREFSENLSHKQEVTVGNRTAEIYKTNNSSTDIFVGFLPINDENQTSYFFNTCNSLNRADLISTVKSLKLRSDINL